MTQTNQIPPIGVPFLDENGHVQRDWYIALSRSFGTAQGTADQAIVDAEAAQTTADQGVSDAAVADGKAVAAQGTADQAVVDAATAQAAADAAQGTADQAIIDAAVAQAAVDAVEELQIVLSMDPSDPLPPNVPNARLLTGSQPTDNGIEIDISVDNVAKLVIRVLTLLNRAPIVVTQPITTSSSVTGSSANFGSATIGSLSLGAGAGASAATTTDSYPIDLGGSTYYMLLSSTP